MRSNKKSNAYVGIVVGFILQLIARIFTVVSESGATLGLVLALLGAGFFIWGCVNYADSKGYSKWLGLLGILSCLGFIVLVLLPDKHRPGSRRSRSS